MPKGILLVQSNPVSAEREAEYNRWYDEEHIPDVRAVPGFVAARRYRVRDAGGIKAGPSTPSYVIIYEVEADDFDVPMEELGLRTQQGRIRLSDAIDLPSIVAFYELIE
ncbi:hypothetical protein I6A84_17685 [Frankia sp. CNm7]|uniref:Uncharacterized protein n=1 Tax=Frankia nepalensis TaxID=1836974 RepID=A0A937URM8_9ACTN|nr:DUF4286 family protein [Frankia nepalensis]MBL7501094.1 hypothetical protein [Frankia nepalensis]MBL7512959.1 hypothetical protein [Frankia nepalensis]MBL7519875.1 hypothetical protein [Frankia nepalensis]MBL7631288.1 hypothetical protein [Frankia nepalensis]